MSESAVTHMQKVEDEISNNFLEMIIGLYIKVRCHSYAKDIKEKVKKKSI